MLWLKAPLHQRGKLTIENIKNIMVMHAVSILPVSLSGSKAQPARCSFLESRALGSSVYVNQTFECAANCECDLESLSLQTES